MKAGMAGGELDQFFLHQLCAWIVFFLFVGELLFSFADKFLSLASFLSPLPVALVDDGLDDVGAELRKLCQHELVQPLARWR